MLVRRSFGRFAAVFAAAFLAVVVATACGGGATEPSATPVPATASPTAMAIATSTAIPTSTPTASLEQRLRKIEERVLAIRGLSKPAPVPNRLVGKAEIEARVRQDIESPEAVQSLKTAEVVFKLLGLIEQDADLAGLYEELLSAQVLGLYDDEAKEFLVLQSGAEFGPLEETTYAHEYVHRIQDAHFDLTKLRETAEAADASTGAGMSEHAAALSALVEGDAVGVQTSYMTRYVTAAQLTLMLQQARVAEKLTAGLPFVLTRGLEFPYLEGTSFVAILRATGGQAAVNAAFKSPPITTEQVLHPDKFLAGEGPVAVALPPEDAFGEGWTAGEADSLGELSLQMWLEGLGTSRNVAATGASGWGGDAFRTYSGPAGKAGMVAVIAWDAKREAAEFSTALTSALAGHGFAIVSDEKPDPGLEWSGPGGYLGVWTFEAASSGRTFTAVAAAPELALVKRALAGTAPAK